MTVPVSMPARSSRSLPVSALNRSIDALHLDREIDCAPDVVEARHVHPAAGKVAVVQGAHLLDAEILCGGVELAGQLVDDGQQLVGGQICAELVEADDVGEDHGDVLVVLGDRLLAFAVALHHRFRHQRQHQAVVLAALLVEQIFLDREIAAHVVERHGQVTEFVAALHRQRHLVVA